MEAALQIENYSLRQQLESLLAEARLNEDKMKRFDQLERQLIGAHALIDLLKLLLTEYRQAFGIEFVSLALVDREYEAARILEAETQEAPTGKPFPGLIFVQSPELLDEIYQQGRHPVLSRYDPQTHGSLFHAGRTEIASVAFLPLVRQEELIGSLHLGSTNPGRYSTDAGTAFLERLANIIAICLETALSQERLKRVGLTDSLTGVQNRRYFEHRCPVEVSQARRHQQPLACMFLDIDKFKRINDTHGHQTGDAVLRGTATVIQEQLRSSDTIARFGGEEFVVLLPQTPGHFALEIAERIRQAVARRPFTSCDGEEIHMTISIGLAMLNHHDQQSDIHCQVEQLIARADKAVYQAKHQGRNRIVSDGVTKNCRPPAVWNRPSTWPTLVHHTLKKLIETGLNRLRPNRSPVI